MDTELAEHAREAAAAARRQADAFPGSIGRDDLPWRVIEAYDARVRRAAGRDPRIEDARDGVLIAAVKLAELRSDDEAEVAAMRGRLVAAIDALERAVLRFGISATRR